MPKAVANKKGLGDKKGELSLVEDVIWTSSKRWNSQLMESLRGFRRSSRSKRIIFVCREVDSEI